MTHANEVDQVRAFIARYQGVGLLSTGARLVDYAGKLYNVSGSTEDPRAVDGHKGVAWKKLLNRFADFSDAECYVTSPLPDEGTTHPVFGVGGHMTPNKDGFVEEGGVSYLMPLCKWHNSPGRNGIAFRHSKTKMLELTGYMEGDSAITFALRFENTNPHTLLFLDPASNHWEFRALSDGEKQGLEGESLAPMSASLGSQDYAVFEKRGDRFFIGRSNVSAAGGGRA